MHKLFFNKLVVVQLLVCFIGSSLLHGMSTILSEHSHNVARDVVIAHCLADDNHEICRAIAGVSKTYNKIIEENYRPKKRVIEAYIQNNYAAPYVVTGHVSWNKDFSKCAWVTISDVGHACDKNHLTLTLLDATNNSSVTMHSHVWNYFYCPIVEDNVRPLFKQEGRVCFHGCGGIKLSESIERYYSDDVLYSIIRPIMQRDVMEYSLDFCGNAERYRCMYEVPGDQNTTARAEELIHLPVLLQALLRSKVVKESKTTSAKTHYIRGTTLDENYKMFKKNSALEKWDKNYHSKYYNSYDVLPKCLRAAIDVKYKEQQREKIGK